MDGTRFDHLTRYLTETPSRRQVVTALVGVLAGACGPFRPRVAQAQPEICPPQTCRTGFFDAIQGTCIYPVVENGTPCTLSDGGGIGMCLGGICACNETTFTCPSGQTCQSAVCVAPCPHAGETRCGGECVSLTKDKNNCGGCGIRCGATDRCVQGGCTRK